MIIQNKMEPLRSNDCKVSAHWFIMFLIHNLFKMVTVVVIFLSIVIPDSYVGNCKLTDRKLKIFNSFKT